MPFEPKGFSATIFKDRYALTVDETWDEACRRVAKQMALAEVPDKQKIYENKFYDVLVNNLFTPGGRIWYNSGRNNPQLLNCFVLNNELDSKEGWGGIAKEMIITSMTGGGCGIDFSDVRPNGAPIFGQRGECPGPVSLMELIDNCAEPVKSGGARRVALMFSLDLNHPDVEEFLDAKLTKGKLTHANVSLKCHDVTGFIKAIKKNENIELSWKGKYKKEINAKDLWDKIVKNAYNSAEPGFLNWEMVENENNILYDTSITTTNPCGEIPLEKYGNCCLGHIVLSRFVKDNDMDWNALGNTIRLGVRFLDNVLNVNTFPLPQMKDNAQKYRRIGLGTTALADALVLLGYRYGSTEANKFIDKLYRFISKNAYEASVMLAVEKGAFPACIPNRFLESHFMKRMTPKICSLISEHGIRNCALLTVAPTGTVSILSDNCSSGIEPIFSPMYRRNYWDKKERKSEIVIHPLFEKFMNEGKSVDHFVSSHELTVKEHLEVQKIVQKHIDNAVSKTINLPHDYPIEDMSALWLEYLPHVKGTTFYRSGSRNYIDEHGVEHEPPLVPLSLEESKKIFKDKNTTYVENQEVDCADCTI